MDSALEVPRGVDLWEAYPPNTCFCGECRGLRACRTADERRRHEASCCAQCRKCRRPSDCCGFQRQTRKRTRDEAAGHHVDEGSDCPTDDDEEGGDDRDSSSEEDRGVNDESDLVFEMGIDDGPASEEGVQVLEPEPAPDAAAPDAAAPDDAAPAPAAPADRQPYLRRRVPARETVTCFLICAAALAHTAARGLVDRLWWAVRFGRSVVMPSLRAAASHIVRMAEEAGVTCKYERCWTCADNCMVVREDAARAMGANASCERCGKALTVKFFAYNVAQQVRNLLAKPSVRDLLMQAHLRHLEKDDSDIYQRRFWLDKVIGLGWLSERRPLSIVFSLFVDGFTPFATYGSKLSSTQLDLEILNLPREVRGDQKNSVIIGIVTPSPKNCDCFVKFALDQLRLYADTQEAPHLPESLRFCIGVLQADLVARWPLLKLRANNSVRACPRCLICGEYAAELKKMVYFTDGRKHRPRTRAQRENAERKLQSLSAARATQAEIEIEIRKNGVTGPSVLAEGGMDLEQDAVFDAQHLIHGFVKMFIKLVAGTHTVFRRGRAKRARWLEASLDEKLVENDLERLTFPAEHRAGPAKFFTKLNGFKSADALDFVRFFGPCLTRFPTLVAVLGDTVAAAMEDFFSVLADVFSPELDFSDQGLDALERRLLRRHKRVEQLLPRELETVVFHGLTHLVEDLRRHGPVACTWVMGRERKNGWLSRHALSRKLFAESMANAVMLFRASSFVEDTFAPDHGFADRLSPPKRELVVHKLAFSLEAGHHALDPVAEVTEAGQVLDYSGLVFGLSSSSARSKLDVVFLEKAGQPIGPWNIVGDPSLAALALASRVLGTAQQFSWWSKVWARFCAVHQARGARGLAAFLQWAHSSSRTHEGRALRTEDAARLVEQGHLAVDFGNAYSQAMIAAVEVRAGETVVLGFGAEFVVGEVISFGEMTVRAVDNGPAVRTTLRVGLASVYQPVRVVRKRGPNSVPWVVDYERKNAELTFFCPSQVVSVCCTLSGARPADPSRAVAVSIV